MVAQSEPDRLDADPSGEHLPTECDLVMKGGITSGIVYPSAVLRLKERYTFHNIGGASAGAIAAVATAAAEYGDRIHAGAGHGYDALRTSIDDLSAKGFLLDLFQPAPDMRPAYDLLIATLKAANPPGLPAAGRRPRRRPSALGSGHRISRCWSRG